MDPEVYEAIKNLTNRMIALGESLDTRIDTLENSINTRINELQCDLEDDLANHRADGT